MTWTLFLLFSALGACLASFVNVVAHRSVTGESWWGRERSRCDSCGTILTSPDLIPIFSFLLRKGKCRHCGAAIGARYVAVELIGASLDVIKKAESRELFRQAMENIGLEIPESGICHTMDDVREWGKKIAFPIIVRPAFTLGGTGGGVR